MLAPQLTGKAQKAFAALEDTEAQEYDTLKAAILRRYNISEETYRERLRSMKREKEESHREMATRVMDLASKWMKKCASVQDVVEMVATEQLINSMADEVRVWVRERKPETCAEAGELADDYERARKNMKLEGTRKEAKGWAPAS